MSGRRREGLTPTLFPFLAVLVCTLGTLILLLAMVAQNAGKAIAASESRAPEPDSAQRPRNDDTEALAQAADQLDRQLREAQWYRAQTVKLRDEQTAELEQRRNQLGHLEDHLRRLRGELDLLSTEVERSLEQKGDAQVAQATLDQLLLQIEAEQAAIGNLEGELQSQKPRIVIVPHKGPNGTDRRPIYIQCDREGVTLQPGGQRIALAHLEPASGRANPLDAALRTIRHHAMQSYGDTVAPYPLLVVAPDGIESYAIARAAMSHWDDQFGYELVPAGMELAFPAADPVLDDKVAAAIRQAVAQREAWARGGGGGGGGGASGAGGGGGGYVGGQGRPGAAEPGLPGQSGGSTGDAAASSGSLAGSGPSAAAISSGAAALGGAGRGSNAASPPASSLPILSAAQMSRGEFSGGTYPGSTNAAMPGAATGSGYVGSSASATGLSGPGGASGAAGSDGARGGPTLAEREAAAEAGRRLQQQEQLGGRWDAAPQSPLASAHLRDPAQAAQPGQQSTGTTGPPLGGSPGGGSEPMTLNPPHGAPQSAASGAPGVGGTTGQATGQPGGSASKGSAGAPGGTGGAQASGSDAMAASQGQPQEAAGMPSLNFSSSSTPPVTRVGKDWGLPSSLTSSRGTEMLRMIRVECHADRFVLLPEGGRGAPTVFRFEDGDIDRASLELATAVRDRADGWGAAMQGARWQPVLDVAVLSGGEFRYQQLLRLMDGSGVTIQARGTR